MNSKIRTLRVPLIFTLVLKKVFDGITHEFNTYHIAGWAKKRGNRRWPDIDKIHLNNSELKGDLECMDAIDIIEDAAQIKVETIFDQTQFHRG